jgi:hypothetical protein
LPYQRLRLSGDLTAIPCSIYRERSRGLQPDLLHPGASTYRVPSVTALAASPLRRLPLSLARIQSVSGAPVDLMGTRG